MCFIYVGVCGIYRDCPGDVSTCGSNYDEYGNPRFEDLLIMDEPVFCNSMNYGFADFDNLPGMITFFFQMLTGASWSG